MVQCLLINRSVRSIKYQNEIPSVGTRSCLRAYVSYIIIIGDGYTAYFISGINYEPNYESNALT